MNEVDRVSLEAMLFHASTFAKPQSSPELRKNAVEGFGFHLEQFLKRQITEAQENQP